MTKTTSIIMLGFGNVGKAFAQLLLDKKSDLAAMYDLELKVVGIGTGSHGLVCNPEGIDPGLALQLAEEGRPLDSLGIRNPDSPLELLKSCQADVLVETTPVNYQTGEPGLSYIRTALQKGMHAVTANKGPVVHGYEELRNLAEQNKRKFYFESAVMDGAPVFSICRECFPASRIEHFRGVLNSTTNLILTRMETGQTFDEAVLYAQSIGIAETDPSGDVDGWDASIKAAALATVLMGIPLLPDQVDREGIGGISLEQVQEASRQGLRWKLICEAQRTENGINASVRPLLISAEDPLYHLEGTSTAITFHTDTLGPLTLREDSPTPLTTAYGLLADILNSLGFSFAAL